MLHGALYFLPLYLITMMAGGLWEALFAAIRRHEIDQRARLQRFGLGVHGDLVREHPRATLVQSSRPLRL